MVSSSVLLILLRFFLRESSHFYLQAQLDWSHMSAPLRYVVRDLHQAFSAESYLPSDLGRIVAHLVAVPIAMKKRITQEVESQHLEQIIF